MLRGFFGALLAFAFLLLIECGADYVNAHRPPAEPEAPQSALAHSPVCTRAYPRGFDGFQRLSPYFRRRVMEPCDPNVIPEIAAFCFPQRQA